MTEGQATALVLKARLHPVSRTKKGLDGDLRAKVSGPGVQDVDIGKTDKF